MIRLPPGRGRLWSWTLDASLFAILRKRKFACEAAKAAPLHVGIMLIEKSFVVCSSGQQSQQPATARGKARHGPVSDVESRSPCRVQTPQSRPVASTGVHAASC